MNMTMIPSELLKDLPEEMQGFEPLAVICNILPEPLMPIMQTYGVYYIASPKPGERYALTQVKWAPLYIDKGDSNFGVQGAHRWARARIEDNRIRQIQGARGIAEDLCRQLNTSDSVGGSLTSPGPFWGKFVLKGVEPTEEELAAAEKRMRDYFLSVIRAADTEWGRTKRLDLIDGRSRIAARHLSVDDREWLSEYIPNIHCPACQETIRSGAKVCRFCGTLLDSNGQMAKTEKKQRATKAVAAD